MFSENQETGKQVLNLIFQSSAIVVMVRCVKA